MEVVGDELRLQLLMPNQGMRQECLQSRRQLPLSYQETRRLLLVAKAEADLLRVPHEGQVQDGR